jgi:hypothetical protein
MRSVSLHVFFFTLWSLTRPSVQENFLDQSFQLISVQFNINLGQQIGQMVRLLAKNEGKIDFKVIETK